MQQQDQQWLRDNAFAVLDAVVDSIITIDESGVIQSVNRATERMFGYDAEELIGAELTKLMPMPDRTNHQNYVDRYLRTRESKIMDVGRELTAQRKNGEMLPIYLAVSEIKTDEGSYFTGIARDMTESKASQAALLEQRERLTRVGRLTTMGEMTASIAHEINQPLTAIALYAQACLKLLSKEKQDLAKIVDGLEKLNTQSLRAGDVIERIQRFVRHEGSDKAAVDLNILIGDLHHLASADARVHGIELKFDLEDSELTTFCDAVQIQQVALNLIRNAIDAMHDIDCRNGNEVVIKSRRLGSYAEIYVVDQGEGIDDDEKPLIFGAFHTTKPEGMGMGLSICRSIVIDHGGEMGFRNNVSDSFGLSRQARVEQGSLGEIEPGCTSTLDSRWASGMSDSGKRDND